MGCRMDRAKDWGVRIKHEASLHAQSSFLTLTYSDDKLPSDGSLSVRECQLFIKRLREKIAPTRVRFYLCGEYGDQLARPHYHVILFGYDFADKTKWRKSASGHMLFRSKLLESLWVSGHSEIGAVTAQSGAYVARYCLKKITGAPAGGHYSGRTPEFALMSTRPGIGAGWFNRYESDAFPSAFLIVDGKKVAVPRYYKGKLRGRNLLETSLGDRDDLERLRLAKGNAYRFTDEFIFNSTDERLAVREEVQRLKQDQFKRALGEK